jgi:GT2 family glycosyltransferase
MERPPQIRQSGFASANLYRSSIASTDGSVDALRTTFPDLDVIASNENLGFASANNLAEKQARGCKLLLLNPDTVVLGQAFCLACGLSFVFNHPEEHRRWRRDNVRTVDVLAGSFLLIDRDLWQRLGGFDSSFFMYGEDEDLLSASPAHWCATHIRSDGNNCSLRCFIGAVRSGKAN